ncbi:hypothetical protein JW752_01770 [Candidatus Peregrinibacteria bacterium]|nr:hypothetical protein [Candidatus Peregrinibacteria bacterium]
MKENPSTPSEHDGAMEFVDKLNFLEQAAQRLHVLERERTDILKEIRGAFKIIFAFMDEPSALTPDWMKRIDSALKSYEDQPIDQASGEVTKIDYRILHEAGIR